MGWNYTNSERFGHTLDGSLQQERTLGRADLLVVWMNYYREIQFVLDYDLGMEEEYYEG